MRDLIGFCAFSNRLLYVCMLNHCLCGINGSRTYKLQTVVLTHLFHVACTVVSLITIDCTRWLSTTRYPTVDSMVCFSVYIVL